MSPPHLDRMILTGFMGSGKTTVGRLVAARLRWSFADLDTEVESQQGLRVSEIFEQRGEAAFREAETEALAGLLGRAQLIVALGGGAAATPAVRKLIASAPRTAVVHLHAEFSVLQDRCLRQSLDPVAAVRPLIQNAEAARLRYLERAPLYAAVADHRVDVSVKGPETVAEEILSVWSTLAYSRLR